MEKILFEDNKRNRVLGYAIGAIVLLVFGALLLTAPILVLDQLPPSYQVVVGSETITVDISKEKFIPSIILCGVTFAIPFCVLTYLALSSLLYKVVITKSKVTVRSFWKKKKLEINNCPNLFIQGHRPGHYTTCYIIVSEKVIAFRTKKDSELINAFKQIKNGIPFDNQKQAIEGNSYDEIKRQENYNEEKLLFVEEFRDLTILSLISALCSIAAIIWIIWDSCISKQPQGNLTEWLITGISMGLILCVTVYCWLRTAKYLVVITDKRIITMSLFGNKNIIWNGEITYKRKKVFFNNSRFTINIGNKSVVVRTRMPKDLEEVLNQLASSKKQENNETQQQ